MRRFGVGIIRVGEELFYLLPEKWIAVARAIDKGSSLKPVIALDGIGQDHFDLLPSLWSHLDIPGFKEQTQESERKSLMNLQVI